MTDASERWLPIPGYEGYYEVSDLGRVRGVDRIVPRKDGRSRLARGALRATPAMPDGRKCLVLARDGEHRHHSVSSLVLSAFVGPRPIGMEVCHNDGDAGNDRVENLRWDTSSENKFDIVRHGHHPQRAKEACPRGHTLEHPNLVACKIREGHRVCLACARARATVQEAAKRGRTADVAVEADRHYERITSVTETSTAS